MGKVFLLDCTLRDGGYCNNWEFGHEAISQIKTTLEDAKIDIIELGFFRNEEWNRDRSVFSRPADLAELLAHKSSRVLYSAMIEGAEAGRQFDLDSLGDPAKSGIDFIRVVIWKRLLQEHIDYCREIMRRGYNISIQPSAVEQYSDEDFMEMLELINELHPFAVYVVDTRGCCSVSQILHYCTLAEKHLDKDVMIGFHGHNNKMQALSCAEAVLNMGLTHDICIDSTIMGMGRGAGNLQTEVIMDYLNKTRGTQYDMLPLTEVFCKHLRQFYDANPWGYTMYHFLSALYGCSPDIASYFRQNRMGEDMFLAFLQSCTPEEMVVFRKELIDKKLKGHITNEFE